MDVRQFLGSSTYLKCADLQGKSVTVQICDVVEETVGFAGEAQQKPVVHFVSQEKGLVLNVTNANTIIDLLGFETGNWTGKEITLYPTTTDFGGKMVDCIRVRMPKSAAPMNTPGTEESPF